MSENKTSKVKKNEIKTYYSRWQEAEGVPIIKGYYVGDLKQVKLDKWERLGGLGAYVTLEGCEQVMDAYLSEIPAGKNLNPEKHLHEELVYVLTGRGATTIWNEGGKKQTFEWQEGSLFSPPLNVWHQHFNGQGNAPARLLVVTNAPEVMNLFGNTDFIFNSNYVFRDRFNGEEDYFSGKGALIEHRRPLWESNFVPDVPNFKLYEWKERGAGGTNIQLTLSHNYMRAHISEFPVGTYKKAHRHGPAAHVLIVKGTGYSMMWPEGSPRMKIDWHVGSLLVPPDGWFHQHFNTGNEPARYLALRWRSRETRLGLSAGTDTSLKLGGNQIEYPDEDPEIRRIYEQELAKKGLTVKTSALK